MARRRAGPERAPKGLGLEHVSQPVRRQVLIVSMSLIVCDDGEVEFVAICQATDMLDSDMSKAAITGGAAIGDSADERRAASGIQCRRRHNSHKQARG